MDKLKPCPFCGRKAFRYHKKYKIGDAYRVYCGNEDCPVSPQTKAYYKKIQAEEAWNRRAEDGN